MIVLAGVICALTAYAIIMTAKWNTSEKGRHKANHLALDFKLQAESKDDLIDAAIDVQRKLEEMLCPSCAAAWNFRQGTGTLNTHRSTIVTSGPGVQITPIQPPPVLTGAIVVRDKIDHTPGAISVLPNGEVFIATGDGTVVKMESGNGKQKKRFKREQP